jgi:Sec-independent protein secretion pathway component TatC
MFSVGPIELGLTVAIAFMALGCFLKRVRGTRWLVASAGCLALASVLTPADIASTVIIAIACFGCFYCGTKQRMSNVAPAA